MLQSRPENEAESQCLDYLKKLLDLWTLQLWVLFRNSLREAIYSLNAWKVHSPQWMAICGDQLPILVARW